MTASIARVRGRFGDLPVPLVQASNDFTERLFDLVDAAVDAGLPLEMVLGGARVIFYIALEHEARVARTDFERLERVGVHALAPVADVAVDSLPKVVAFRMGPH